MKILHLADLHLGKKTFGYSLIEDQKDFLEKTINFMKENDIKKVIIAGDIYDVSSPSGEAITLFSDFMTDLKKNDIEAFIISGNHDSKDRVGIYSKLVDEEGIHIRTDIKDAITPIISDGVCFYLIPYTSAADINLAFDQNFDSYADAMSYLISQMNLSKNEVNIAVAHQLVLNEENLPLFGGSEEPVVGTISNIPASVFSDFDYVALGHIHKPQAVASNARYAGSPLCYHADETKYEKKYLVLDIEGKNITFTEHDIKPLRNMVVLTGDFEDILLNHPKNLGDYVHAVITGAEVDNAMEKLKDKYHYALSVRYDRPEAQGADVSAKITDIESRPIGELFAQFFHDQTDTEMSDYQRGILEDLLKEEEE